MDGSEELLTKKIRQLNKKLGKHFGFSKLTKKMIQKRLL